MVYTRKNKSVAKKRTYRRRWTRRGSGIPRFVNKWIETKKNIAGYTEQALTSASTYPGIYQDTVMSLAQGNTMCQRNGNWVNGVGYKSRFVLHNNATDPQFIRYLMLVNKQGSANTNHTTGAKLFDNSSGTNTDLSTFTTNGYLVRRLNRDAYHVLVDKIIRLGGTSDANKIFTYKKYVPLKGRKYNFDTTTSVAPTRNQIIEIWLTAEADDDAVGQTVELTGEATFYFKDA